MLHVLLFNAAWHPELPNHGSASDYSATFDRQSAQPGFNWALGLKRTSNKPYQHLEESKVNDKYRYPSSMIEKQTSIHEHR